MAAVHATCAALQKIADGAVVGEDAQRIARECIACLRKTSVDETRRMNFGTAEERMATPVKITLGAETPHATSELFHPASGQMVQIDNRLVPIIQALWRAGIDTRNCCEGKSGSTQYMAYIQFPTAGAIDFVAAAINKCGGKQLRRWASGLVTDVVIFDSQASVTELTTLIDRPFILELDTNAFDATVTVPVCVSSTLRFATEGIEELTEAVVLYAQEQAEEARNGKSE